MKTPVTTLTTPQVTALAEEIAATAQAIRQLAVMLDVASDRMDRGALSLAIEALANHAGGLADLVNTAQGGVAVVGSFADWCTPESLSR